MFERSNRTDGRLSVEITFRGGRRLSGRLVVPAGRTLPEALNGASAFIEFEPAGDHQPIFIAKTALEAVKALG